MNIFNFLKNFVNQPKNNKQNNNIDTLQGKKLFYEFTTKVSNTDTDGRQNLLRKLFKDYDLPSSFNPNALHTCNCEIEEHNYITENYGVDVFINDDNNYPYLIGYLSKKYLDILNEKTSNDTLYTSVLYATKNNQQYDLYIQIKIYK